MQHRRRPRPARPRRWRPRAAARSRRAPARPRPRRRSGRARRPRRRARRRSARRPPRRRGARSPGPSAEANGREWRGDVVARDDADHAGQRERGGGVDRADAGVRERRAHDRRDPGVRAADRGRRRTSPARAASASSSTRSGRAGRRGRAPALANVSWSPRSGMINRCRLPERAILAAVATAEGTALSSVDRALRLLEELARHGPLGATELANRTGCAKATAFRLARTLQARGFVVQNQDSTLSPRPALPAARRRACTRASTSGARRFRPWRRCATRPARRCS